MDLSTVTISPQQMVDLLPWSRVERYKRFTPSWNKLSLLFQLIPAAWWCCHVYFPPPQGMPVGTLGHNGTKQSFRQSRIIELMSLQRLCNLHKLYTRSKESKFQQGCVFGSWVQLLPESSWQLMGRRVSFIHGYVPWKFVHVLMHSNIPICIWVIKERRERVWHWKGKVWVSERNCWECER